MTSGNRRTLLFGEYFASGIALQRAIVRSGHLPLAREQDSVVILAGPQTWPAPVLGSLLLLTVYLWRRAQPVMQSPESKRRLLKEGAFTQDRPHKRRSPRAGAEPVS